MLSGQTLTFSFLDLDVLVSNWELYRKSAVIYGCSEIQGRLSSANAPQIPGLRFYSDTNSCPHISNRTGWSPYAQVYSRSMQILKAMKNLPDGRDRDNTLFMIFL